MRVRRIRAWGITSGIVLAGAAAWGQAAPRPPGASAASPAPSPSVRVETASLELIPPERFLVPVVLEPVRRVTLKATADGVVQSLRGYPIILCRCKMMLHLKDRIIERRRSMSRCVSRTRPI